MSDILIKGMKMPTKQVLAVINPDGLVEILNSDNILIEEFQATQVPPHGRCIDADAFIKSDRMVGKLMMFGGEYVYTQAEIDRAPTILPAEGD